MCALISVHNFVSNTTSPDFWLTMTMLSLSVVCSRRIGAISCFIIQSKLSLLSHLKFISYGAWDESGRYHTNWRAPNSIFDANVSEWWTDCCCCYSCIVHETHSLMVEWTLEAVFVCADNEWWNEYCKTDRKRFSFTIRIFLKSIFLDLIFFCQSMHLNLLSGWKCTFRKSRKSNKLLN